uniref:Zinc finger CCHC domain-containing protein n=1 Tax=Knipowitschia caucasica TaxID=637954 RepID=A0AAV2MP90_KNICA
MAHGRPLGRSYSSQFGQHWARLHYTGQSEFLPTRDYVDGDIELYLQRYCSILSTVKPVDKFGLWYGVRKYKKGHTFFTCPSSYANKAKHAQPKDNDKAGSATNAWAEPCTQSSTLPSGSSKPTGLPPEATAQPTLGPEGPRARPNKPHPDPSVRSKLLPGNKSGSSEPHGKPHEQQSGTGVQTQVGVQSSKTSRAAAQPTTSSVTAAQPTTSSVTAAQPTTSSVIVDPSTEPPPVISDQPSSTAPAEECVSNGESRPSGNAETEAELETRLDSRDTQKGHAGGTRRTLEEQPLYQPLYQPGAAPGSARNRRDGSRVFCGGRTRCSRSGPGIYRTPGFETHTQSARAHYQSPPGCDFPCPPNQCDRGSDRRRQTRALGVRANWYAEPARPGSAADQTSPGWLDCARQINEDHRSSETSSSGSSELSPPDCDVSSVLGEVTKEEVLSAIKELNSGADHSGLAVAHGREQTLSKSRSVVELLRYNQVMPNAKLL